MRGLFPVLVVLAACAGGPRESDLRGTLRSTYGYSGREDDSASIRYLEARPDLVDALLCPETVALSRVLAADYATPFDPSDAPELLAWAASEKIAGALTKPRTRQFARTLADIDVVDRNTLRIRGGPLFDRAPEILAALAVRPGVSDLLRALGRDYAYRLRTTDAPALLRLLGDTPTREALARPDVAAGWALVAREGRLAFAPDRAREIVVLAGAPELPGVLRSLRTRYEIRTTSDGPPALALIVETGRVSDLSAPAHRAILAKLRELPGPSLRLADLTGTLELARSGISPDLLDRLARLGWRPRLDDPDETSAILDIDRAERASPPLPPLARPADAGRGAPLLSVRRLYAARGGLVDSPDPLDPWLDPGDRAFREMLPDPGGDRGGLEAAIRATRGDRPISERPRTGYDETEASLRFFSRPDLLRIRALQASLADPDLVGRLIGEAIADREDSSAEYGGTLVLREGRVIWRREEAVPGGAGAGDRTHRLSVRPDPTAVLATYHFHARGGAAVAGPSTGRVIGDLAAARRLGMDGVVITLLTDTRIDIDFHDPGGHVFDLGVYP